MTADLHEHNGHWDVTFQCCDDPGGVNLTRQQADRLIGFHEHWFRPPPPPPPPNVIDAAHLERQRAWSRETFGPGRRLKGVIDHIKRELVEVEAAPDDITEWADLAILVFDGAWRSGHGPQEIIDAIVTKQSKNEQRTWPDWRTMSEDVAIEHVRSTDG